MSCWSSTYFQKSCEACVQDTITNIGSRQLKCSHAHSVVRNMMSRVVLAVGLWSVVSADQCAGDATSALQKTQIINHGSKVKSQVERVAEAVRNTAVDASFICLSVEAGEVAPLLGTFTPHSGEKRDVNVGDVADDAGEYCVQNSVVALVQRAGSLHGGSSFEAAVANKDKDTDNKDVDETDSGSSNDQTVSKKDKTMSGKDKTVSGTEKTISGKKPKTTTAPITHDFDNVIPLALD